MKDSIVSIVVIIILSFLCQEVFGLPWWSVYVVPFVFSYIFEKKEWNSIMVGFIAIFLYWITASYLIDIGNESILSSKIGSLFMGIGTWGLILVTGLTGGVTGALGGWSGSLLRILIKKH